MGGTVPVVGRTVGADTVVGAMDGIRSAEEVVGKRVAELGASVVETVVGLSVWGARGVGLLFIVGRLPPFLQPQT